METMVEILEVNLLTKEETVNDIAFKFNDFKFTVKGFKEQNSELDLKVNDTISFIGGYDNNIRYTTKILGFDKDNKAFVAWDCYWFPIDLNERDYIKL